MEILNQSQLNSILGKNTFFFNNEKLMCTQYAAGIEPFDSLIDPASLFSTTIPTNIVERHKGIEISIMYKFKIYSVAVPFDKISTVTIEDKETIFHHSERSVVARAVVGGLILGPLGAIIGGMTALEKNQSAIHTPDILLTIMYLDANEQQSAIVFTCKQVDRKRLFKIASQIFKKKLIIN